MTEKLDLSNETVSSNDNEENEWADFSTNEFFRGYVESDSIYDENELIEDSE
jgi:hypothetical protein